MISLLLSSREASMHYLSKQSAKDLQHLQNKLISLNKLDNMPSINSAQIGLAFRHSVVPMPTYQVLSLKLHKPAQQTEPQYGFIELALAFQPTLSLSKTYLKWIHNIFTSTFFINCFMWILSFRVCYLEI